jgi:MYXO-CTERM domain-containing protein
LIDNGTVENVEVPIDADLDDGTTMYAVPHVDEDGDGEFVTGLDPAYERNGSTISASAEISIRTPTPTTTEPPTTTTTERITANTTTVPQNDTTTTTTGPGLTLGLGILALLGVALLAARRER